MAAQVLARGNLAAEERVRRLLVHEAAFAPAHLAAEHLGHGALGELVDVMAALHAEMFEEGEGRGFREHGHAESARRLDHLLGARPLHAAHAHLARLRCRLDCRVNDAAVVTAVNLGR